MAEHRNRSLLDITRCLLLDKALLGHLWGEEIKATNIILNLWLTKQHPNKTLNKKILGKKPFVTHLCVFGSPTFTHIPKPSWTELKPCSKSCVLLSFDEDAKAYRCYRPSTMKVLSTETSTSKKITCHPQQQNLTKTISKETPHSTTLPHQRGTWNHWLSQPCRSHYFPPRWGPTPPQILNASVGAYIFFLGKTPISWNFKK